VREAQDAANEETKGSVGDKHETGRAMMQIERDKHARMLADALEQKQLFEKTEFTKPSAIIHPGSLVITSQGNFFISVGVGKIQTDEMDVYAIAPQSPVGSLLMGKRSGDQIQFKDRNFIVKEII
jgi:transcription elongation GreA/GreB family factor